MTKPMVARWHRRLGHASPQIVQRVLSQKKLSFAKEMSIELVCDACQMVKSHQLPFLKSSTVSQAPLELVFSEV
jgi:hypothetical protein